MRNWILAGLLVGCGGLPNPKTTTTAPGSPGTGAGTGTGTGTGTGSLPGTGTVTDSGSGTGGGTGTGTSTGAPEDCFDQADNDGDGLNDCLDPDCTPCANCAAVLEAQPTAFTGIYQIKPGPIVPPVNVYCDMDTDGGGWTLVSSSLAAPDDARVDWHADLTTLDPNFVTPGVWDGLRLQTVPDLGYSDIRFACSQVSGGAFRVDLSFYNTRWYAEITAGTDADSCFNEGDGAGMDPPPARRNNLTGDFLPAGDFWNSGVFEGEDACESTDDFTVDFDDRGMGGNAVDGTDWGEANDTDKCGPGGGIGFFIFMRPSN